MKIDPKRGDYIAKRCDTLNNDQLKELRCLKENIVPKSVKLNFKQFKPLNECKILCKTHCQIINSRVSKTNRTIDKISKDMETLRSSIKSKVKGCSLPMVMLEVQLQIFLC